MVRRSLVTFVLASLSTAALGSAAVAAAPWADRGWVQGPSVQGSPTLENPKHGLRVLWPAGWTIDQEDPANQMTLLSMKKLDGAGKQRVGVVITTRTTGKATAEEFYNQEAGWYRQQSGIQILDAGPARAAGMYELQFLLPQYKVRVRDVYFTRNGNGYSIALSQATDATAAELAQLDRVRRYMGLPDARALPAQPPAPPPAAARLGAIVFARTMLPDLTPVDRGVKFPAGTNAIHAIFAADDLKADDVIGDVLYLGTKKVLEENKTASQVLGRAPGKHDTIAFNFSYSTGGFPAGVYRLELSLNGKVVQTGTFEILAK